MQGCHTLTKMKICVFSVFSLCFWIFPSVFFYINSMYCTSTIEQRQKILLSCRHCGSIHPIFLVSLRDYCKAPNSDRVPKVSAKVCQFTPEMKSYHFQVGLQICKVTVYPSAREMKKLPLSSWSPPPSQIKNCHFQPWLQFAK